MRSCEPALGAQVARAAPLGEPPRALRRAPRGGGRSPTRRGSRPPRRRPPRAAPRERALGALAGGVGVADGGAAALERGAGLGLVAHGLLRGGDELVAPARSSSSRSAPPAGAWASSPVRASKSRPGLVTATPLKVSGSALSDPRPRRRPAAARRAPQRPARDAQVAQVVARLAPRERPDRPGAAVLARRGAPRARAGALSPAGRAAAPPRRDVLDGGGQPAARATAASATHSRGSTSKAPARVPRAARRRRRLRAQTGSPPRARLPPVPPEPAASSADTFRLALRAVGALAARSAASRAAAVLGRRRIEPPPGAARPRSSPLEPGHLLA